MWQSTADSSSVSSHGQWLLRLQTCVWPSASHRADPENPPPCPSLVAPLRYLSKVKTDREKLHAHKPSSPQSIYSHTDSHTNPHIRTCVYHSTDASSPTRQICPPASSIRLTSPSAPLPPCPSLQPSRPDVSRRSDSSTHVSRATLRHPSPMSRLTSGADHACASFGSAQRRPREKSSTRPIGRRRQPARYEVTNAHM